MAYSHSIRAGSRIEVYPALQRFFRVHTIGRVSSALRALTENDDARETAIQALRHPGADPDTQEWAERYLCGMADADATEFMTNRRAQS